MRTLPAVLIALVILTGCAAPAPVTPTVTMIPRDGPEHFASTPAPAFETQSASGSTVYPPRIRLVDESGEMFDGMQSSFCWPQATFPGGQHQDLCADYILPEKLTIFMAHPAGEPLEIRFEGSPPDTASATLYADLRKDAADHTTLTLSGGGASWLIDQPPGSYALMVSAFWDKRGDTSMLFGLTLQ